VLTFQKMVAGSFLAGVLCTVAHRLLLQDWHWLSSWVTVPIACAMLAAGLMGYAGLRHIAIKCDAIAALRVKQREEADK
jgi:hypothetical protein